VLSWHLALFIYLVYDIDGRSYDKDNSAEEEKHKYNICQI
jgi:hypothetical protein